MKQPPKRASNSAKKAKHKRAWERCEHKKKDKRVEKSSHGKYKTRKEMHK